MTKCNHGLESDLSIKAGRDKYQAKLAGKNHLAEDKMVAKHLSMAEELLNAIAPKPFTKVLCLLHDSRATTIKNFKIQQRELMKHHWIDSSVLLNIGQD